MQYSLFDKTYNQLVNTMAGNRAEFEGLTDLDGFMEWAKYNMHIYNEFERQALTLRRHGRREHYSGWAIINKLRWDSLFKERGNSEFKINNNCIAYLTRLTMILNPELAGMFRTCKPKLAA